MGTWPLDSNPLLMAGVTLRCVGNWYLCRNSVCEHRSLGHVIESGLFFTKTVTGFVVRGILKEKIFPIPEFSKLTMASRNSASAIPRNFRVALCLNAPKVKTGPENRMQAVFTANAVGCGFSSSSVGVINSPRN